MANWDWQVFCKDTIDGEVVANCWGSGKEITYLHWMIEAWGWTLAVSLVGLVIALVVGSLIGVMRTLPNSPWLVRFGNAWWSCSATSRCWCRCSSGTSCCPR